MDQSNLPVPGNGQVSAGVQPPAGDPYQYGWQEPQADLRDYLRIASKRRRAIVFTFAAVVLMAAAWVYTQPRVYRATAKVQVVQPEPVLALGPMAQRFVPEDSLKTQAKIAQSWLLAREAVALLDRSFEAKGTSPAGSGTASLTSVRRESQREAAAALTRAYPGITARHIRMALLVTMEEPDVLAINAEHTDPECAMNYANAVARAYMINSGDTARLAAKSVKEYTQKAMPEIEQRLQTAERKISDLRRRYGIKDLDSVREMKIREAFDYASQAERARAQVRASEIELASLHGRLAVEGPTRVVKRVVNDAVAAGYQHEMAQAEVELARARASYPDDHPKVLTLRDRLQEITGLYEQRYGERRGSFILEDVEEPNPNYDILREREREQESRLAGLKAQAQAMDSLAAKMRADLPSSPDAYVELARLENEKELQEKTYLSLLEQYQQALITERRAQGNVRPVDEAQIPGSPVRPRPKQTLLLAAILGLMAGISLALLLEHTDMAIEDPDELMLRTGIPTLGFIPAARSLGPDSRIARRSPRSPISEGFRSIRSNLRFAHLDSPLRTVMVTSAGASEGKSFTAANLATVFAQTGMKTLLVDTDLRRPVQHRQFGGGRSPGLTDVLAGEVALRDVIRPTDTENLSLLPSGVLPPNPSELLDSQRMAGVMEELKECADIIIFDTPPALVVTDAVVLSSRVDAMILVVEQARGNVRAISEIRRLVEQARGKIAGAVVNKVKAGGGSYYYYHYYQHYYYGQADDTTHRKRRRRELRDASDEPALVQDSDSETRLS